MARLEVTPEQLNEIRGKEEEYLWALTEGAQLCDIIAGMVLHLIKPVKLTGPRLYSIAQETLLVGHTGWPETPTLRRLGERLQAANRR